MMMVREVDWCLSGLGGVDCTMTKMLRTEMVEERKS